MLHVIFLGQCIDIFKPWIVPSLVGVLAEAIDHVEYTDLRPSHIYVIVLVNLTRKCN